MQNFKLTIVFNPFYLHCFEYITTWVKVNYYLLYPNFI